MFQAKDPQGVLRPFSFRSYDKYPVGKDETSLRHVWYSKQMAQRIDHIACYRLCDYEVVVDVTATAETEDHGCHWDDMVYLGVGWYVGTKDNDRSLNRGFDSSYRSTNPCKEVNINGYSPQLLEEIAVRLLADSQVNQEPGIITIDSISNSQVVPDVSFIRSRIHNQQAFNLNAYGNSYQAARQSMGDHDNHSGVDAVEPAGHPDNPTFVEIPNTFRVRTIQLEGAPIGANRGGDGQGWPTFDPHAQQ